MARLCMRQNDPVGLTVCKHWGRETKPFTLILLYIFANLPVFTATPERTFSAMKTLKTYLRFRLTEEIIRKDQQWHMSVSTKTFTLTLIKLLTINFCVEEQAVVAVLTRKQYRQDARAMSDSTKRKRNQLVLLSELNLIFSLTDCTVWHCSS